MFRMLFHPGEIDPRHSKYDILHAGFDVRSRVACAPLDPLQPPSRWSPRGLIDSGALRATQILSGDCLHRAVFHNCSTIELRANVAVYSRCRYARCIEVVLGAVTVWRKNECGAGVTD